MGETTCKSPLPTEIMAELEKAVNEKKDYIGYIDQIINNKELSDKLKYLEITNAAKQEVYTSNEYCKKGRFSFYNYGNQVLFDTYVWKFGEWSGTWKWKRLEVYGNNAKGLYGVFTQTLGLSFQDFKAYFEKGLEDLVNKKKSIGKDLSDSKSSEA